MKASKISVGTLEDVKVNIKLKLSALWATLMFIYIYVDIIGFYERGMIEEIIAGRVWVFDITQTWGMSALILMTIPSLMTFLSLALAARVNRWVNMILASLYIIVAINNPIGETWIPTWFGSIVEILLLALIIWHAWKWP
ncbi:MAG: DUF6326 family protein, partial [Chloroflexota bacterium]